MKTHNSNDDATTTTIVHPRRRSSAVATAEQIQKLVAVIQRQFTLRGNDNVAAAPPDNAAGRALGYQLGAALTTFVTVCLDETVLRSVLQDQLLENLLLCGGNNSATSSSSYPLHPSVTAALFQQMQQDYAADKEDLIDLHWLATWILRLEEAATAATTTTRRTTNTNGTQIHASLQSTLQHALYTYRTTLLQHTEVSASQFLQLYQRLQQEATQLQLVALAIPAAVRNANKEPQWDLLAPLWTVAALQQQSTSQAWAILTHTSRVVGQWIAHPTTTSLTAILQVFDGMTRTLQWSLLVPMTTTSQQQQTMTTWWFAWWQELIQLGKACWQTRIAGNPLSIPMFITWWQGLWTENLPCLLSQVKDTGDTMVLQDTFAMYLEEELLNETARQNPLEWSLVQQHLQWTPSSALAWASWFLSSPEDNKQSALQFWQTMTSRTSCLTVASLRRIVMQCLASDDHWQVGGLAENRPGPSSSSITHQNRFELVAPLLPVSTEQANLVWKELLENCDFSQSKYSSMQQSTALLCGMLLLQNNRQDGFLFLEKLLHRYSHLSITVMPLVISLLNDAAARVDGQEFLHVFDFACRVLVLDPHCATEFWNVLLRLLQPEQLANSLRGTILRYFPKLCQANKRLYRRIIETLSGAVGEANLEIRLAVAATVAELAEHDLVRDVSDVIGWIQGWLSIMEPQKPMERLMVYYSLESLHYLVLAEELDFDVVVKVLSKRLCPISDVKRIQELHPVIQEALVRLLGDGECGSDDTDEDEMGDVPLVATVSPQVQRAVQTLLELGVMLLDMSLSESLIQESSSKDLLLNYRILHGIVDALNKYSNLALGLDEEGFRETILAEASSSPGGPSENYRHLQCFVVKCVENLPDIERDGPKDSLVQLARRLVKFEQDSLGTSLWLKKGKSAVIQTKVSTKSIQSIMPDPGTVEELTSGQTSMVTSVARLFCSHGSNLVDLQDEANSSIETDSPILLVLALQGHLSIAARIVSTQSNRLDKLIKEVEALAEDAASADATYLSLATLSLYIQFELRESDTSEKTLVEAAIERIVDAFRGFRFENVDLAKICLGVAGANSLRSGKLAKTSEIVEMLIDSIKGYGGEPSFGAFYGMCLIGQMLPVFQQEGSTDTELAVSLYYRIVSLVVEELLQCYEAQDNTITSLLACLKSGDVQSDILTWMRLIPPQSLLLDPSKVESARHLSLCCAVALPSMAHLNDQMFFAIVHLFELLEWGGGKGFVIPPLLNTGRAAGILESNYLSARYKDYAILLEQRMSSECPSDLDDILLAVSGASSESTSHYLRRSVVGNPELLNDEERARALLAVLMKSVGMPCFGAALFPQLPFIVPGVSKLDTREVLETLEEAATSENEGANENKYAEMGILALAVTASLSGDGPNSVQNALPTSASTNVVDNVEPVVSTESLAKLPMPIPGTVLSNIMTSLEDVLMQQGQGEVTKTMLVKLMGTLELVSLPKQFSKNLLHPLLGILDSESAKAAWVSLLVSQCHGRRPATMDGSDFVHLFHQLAAADENEWLRNFGLGKPQRTFVKGIEHFLPKCSPTHVNHVLTSVWRHCWRHEESLQHCFLSVCKNLLTKSQLPRKLIEAVADTLLNQVLIDLQSVPLERMLQQGEERQTTFSVYVACIRHISYDLLDKNDFFRYAKSPGVPDGEVLRVLCAAQLFSASMFDIQRRQQERSKIVSFLARGLKVLGDDISRDDLRHISCSLVEAVDSSHSTAEQLAEVFEVLLLLPPHSSTFGLEWLALFVRKTAVAKHSSPVELSLAYLWCGPWHVSPSLSILAPLVVADLPVYLGQLVQQEQISSTIFRLLHRLLAHWTPPAASPATIHVLRRALATCRPAKEDILASVVTDSLLASMSNEEESSTAV